MRLLLDLEIQLQDWRRKSISLVQEQQVAKYKQVEMQRQKNFTSYADNKHTIRNLALSVSENPGSEVLEILDRMSINIALEQFSIVNCSPMLATPWFHQTTLEAASPGLKFEIVTRFRRLQDCNRIAFNRLRVKVVKNAMFGKKHIRQLRLEHDQIVVLLTSETNPTEIEDEGQLEGVLARIRQIASAEQNQAPLEE